MSTLVKGRTDRGGDAEPSRYLANAYGRFAADGRAYLITDPKTPRPWSNIISNPRMGLAVSQSGSGFTWIDNSQLAVITRWQQEFSQDSSGKFLYLRDADTGELWSLSPAPVWADLDAYECEHGLGYTTFTTEVAGIRARWTLFCDATDTVEYWHVTLENQTDRLRRLEICAYLEWNCGVSPSPRREFHKLFIETSFDARRHAVFARNHMWEVPGDRYGHWNTPFPYVSALACTEPILSAQGDKSLFMGRNGDPKAPAALSEGVWRPAFGRHEDAIAAMRSGIELKPSATHEMGYALVVGPEQAAVEKTVEDATRVGTMTRALEVVRMGWRDRLAAHRVDTPEATVDFLANDWLRYQAISGRIWGRCGYYQQSGAFGFRDQLQDSQVWLTIDPGLCRDQINTHAAHQFADGSVYHWWHPLSEQGLVTKMTDDLLWLGFVVANYIRETGRWDVLEDAAPFIDNEQPASILEHVRRAFARVFERTSARGLPYIGAGDWNDGLSAAGLEERGESIWLGHFLAGLLGDWAEILRHVGDAAGADDFAARRAALVAAINEHGWDGEWYMRATLDDGSKLGSSACRVGKIFLNAQTWAVLNNVAPPDRARTCMAAMKEHLAHDVGALLLAPAFDEPNPAVGYITRYAPGLRENGGVYTHAATWAIAAAAKMGDRELTEKLLTAINPAMKDPELYWAEPYVTPGNVDGPDSLHCGRGGWTWYTGSAAWLHRVFSEWVLGVRPEWDGLRVSPCLPAGWQRAAMKRPYRGTDFMIEIEQGETPGEVTVTLDGEVLPENFIPASAATGGTRMVTVRC